MSEMLGSTDRSTDHPGSTPTVREGHHRDDRLHDVMAYLNQVRVSQGLSITDVAQRSALPPAFIQAIDQGEFQSLPETLPKGVYIQRYADALGLKGSEVAIGFSRRASAR